MFKRRRSVLIGPAALALTLAGFITPGNWRPASAATALPKSVPPACYNPITTWPLADRVNQVLMVSGQFSALSASNPEAQAGVGALVLFGQPPAGSGPAIQSGLAALQAKAAVAGHPAMWMSTDEEGGYVARLSNVIGPLPAPRQMASTWSTAQTAAAMATHGRAMRALGVTMDLAPVVDVSPAGNPVADEGDRSFSDIPQTAAAYGLAYAAGLESAGVVPVLKHFPGLGHASADTDNGPATDPSLSQLEGDDLIPFEQGINAGLPVVMVGHPSVPGLTGTTPASMAPATYQLLRGQLHFGGVAITDSLGAKAISTAGYTEPQAAVRALEAGADMAMIDSAYWSAAEQAVAAAVTGGGIPAAVLDSDVRAVLRAKGLAVCPTVAMSASTTGGGYRITGSGGGVLSFATAGAGSVSGVHLSQPVVGMATTPTGNGYWLVAADGGVFTYGDAHYYGSTANTHLNQPVVGIAPTPTGNGYWLVAADGGVFTYGDAHYYGSTANTHLNQPVVGIAPTPTGNGYWLVAADGGVFTYGDAHYYGSTANTHLNQPVVGIAPTPTGNGYWLVAADGGVFTYGDAHYYGSTANTHLNQPVVGIAPTPTGNGYWLVAADGGIFNFGDAHYYGSGASST